MPIPIAKPKPPAAFDTWRAFELRAGMRWTTWLGAAALVVGAALFIRLAVEQGWLGPVARLGLGVAAGIGFMAAGSRAQRARMRVLAHGLSGAGLGVVYISVYVASATHGLLAPELAFGAMVIVTIVGTALAVSQDSQSLAVLAWFGGLATPVLVPAVGTRDMTSVYVLVLAVAGTACAALRGWRSLAAIAVLGTHVALIASLAYRRVPADWERELAWFATSHAAIVITPIAIAVWHRTLAPMWSTLAALSTVSAIGAAFVIPDHDSHVFGVYALLFSIGHTALATVVRRLATDDTSRVTFPAIAIAFATIAFPLLLPPALTTCAWSIEAITLLALSRAPRDHALRVIALAVLVVASLHALWTAKLAHDAVNRVMLIGVPAAAWAFARLHWHRHATLSGERWIALTAGLGGTAFALVVGHVEIYDLLGRAHGAALVPLWWTTGSLLVGLIAGRSRVGHDAAAMIAAIAAWLAFVAYRDVPPDSLVVLNVRCGAAVLVLGAIAALGTSSGRWSSVAGPAALGGLVVLVSAELRDQTALSIAWSALGAILLTLGFAARRRALRLAGLGLLGLVTTKIMLVDLAGASSLLRVVSLVVLGVILISASYAYHRLTARDSLTGPHVDAS